MGRTVVPTTATDMVPLLHYPLQISFLFSWLLCLSQRLPGDMIWKFVLKEPKALITMIFSRQDYYTGLFVIKTGQESAKWHLSGSPEFDPLVWEAT